MKFKKIIILNQRTLVFRSHIRISVCDQRKLSTSLFISDCHNNSSTSIKCYGTPPNVFPCSCYYWFFCNNDYILLTSSVWDIIFKGTLSRLRKIASHSIDSSQKIDAISEKAVSLWHLSKTGVSLWHPLPAYHCCSFSSFFLSGEFELCRDVVFNCICSGVCFICDACIIPLRSAVL